MSALQKRLHTRTHWLLLSLVLVLASIILIRSNNEPPEIAVQGATATARPPKPNSPAVDSGERSVVPESIELRGLNFTLQRRPGAEFVPLLSATAVLRGADGEHSIAIERGAASVPAAWLAGTAELIELTASDGSKLNFDRQMLGERANVRCYSYAGFFASCGVDGGGDVIAVAFAPGLSRLNDFRVPPSVGHVVALPTEGSNPTYVATVDSASHFYLVRSNARAWERFEASATPSGTSVELSSVRCGTVDFDATAMNFAQPLRLVVRGSLGQIMIAAQFTPDMVAPIDGWPIGEYSAFLTLAASDSQEHALTSIAKFVVSDGQLTHVSLEATQEVAQPARTGFLRGVLQFEGWELVQPWYERFGITLNIEALIETQPEAIKRVQVKRRKISTQRMTILAEVAAGNPVWSWDAGETPVGRYRLHVEPLRAWIDFEVQAGQTTVLDDPIPTLSVLALNFSNEVDIGSLAPYLSVPPEWTTQLNLMEAPPLIAEGRDSALLISPPGRYTLSLMQGAGFVDYKLDLVPGWNTLDCNVRKVATAVVAFVDEQGQPVPWTREHWNAIAFESVDGKTLRATPTYVRRQGFRGWSEGTLELPQHGQVRIVQLTDKALDFATNELSLQGGERAQIVVR